MKQWEEIFIILVLAVIITTGISVALFSKTDWVIIPSNAASKEGCYEGMQSEWENICISDGHYKYLDCHKKWKEIVIDYNEQAAYGLDGIKLHHCTMKIPFHYLFGWSMG